jgi:hypothetical protein
VTRFSTGFALRALLALLLVTLSGAAAQAADIRVQKCAKRITQGIDKFTEAVIEEVGECHATNVADDDDVDCAEDEDVVEEIEKTKDKLEREVGKCDAAAHRAICALEGRNMEQFLNNVSNGPAAPETRLRDVFLDVFVTPFGPSCPRPGPEEEVSRDAESCADDIGQHVQGLFEELEKCFFGCMQDALRQSAPEPCVDTVTGLPVKEKVIECVAEQLGEVIDDVYVPGDFVVDFVNDCEDEDEGDSLMVELGCPMGADDLVGAARAIQDEVYAIVRDLNLRIFRSSCRGEIDEAEEPVLPAVATLLPSLTQKLVNCGDTLDALFFGTDTTLRLESDLDCGPKSTPTDGIIVSKSGVTISGNAKKYRLIGPHGSSNRTGAGIRVAAGAVNVKLRDIRSIEFFGVGVLDSGNNLGLELSEVTVRRNVQAGVRLTSSAVLLEDVTADRNVVGLHLLGDDIVVQASQARLSTGVPGYGVLLAGTDTNGNGRAVRLSQMQIDQNVVGVRAEGAGHIVEESSFRSNTSKAIDFTADDGVVDDNSIKQGLGDGVVVSGDGNAVTANRSDENAGAGFVISGTGNVVDGNGAGTLTDNGNLGVGYLISGIGNELTSNRAEANLQGGYKVTAATAVFRGNDSASNTGVGFEFTTGGMVIDTNVAQSNSGFEFVFAPGNSGQGNRANGATFALPAGGGPVE